MNSKTFKANAMDQLIEARGVVHMVIFKKALEKAKRHMRNKYGSIRYDLEVAESGYNNVVCFYNETLAKPSGQGTINHETAHNIRRNS